MVALVACVRLGGFGTWIESRVGARSSFGAGEAGGVAVLFSPGGKVGWRPVEVVRCELSRLAPCAPEDAPGHGASHGDAGDDVHHAVGIGVGEDIDEQGRDEEEELNGEEGGGLLDEHGLDVFGVQVVAAGGKDAVDEAAPTGLVELADGEHEAEQVEEQQGAKQADDVEAVEVPRAKVGGGDDERDDLLLHVPDGAGAEAKDEHGCADGDAEHGGAALHPCVASVGHDDAVGDDGDEPCQTHVPRKKVGDRVEGGEAAGPQCLLDEAEVKVDGGDNVPAEGAHPHGEVDERDDGGVCALRVDMTKDVVGRRVDHEDLGHRGEVDGKGQLAAVQVGLSQGRRGTARVEVQIGIV
ncbi:hypothetical protein L1887_55330 [Cichorium endivia]|nr:hypothetical protein L1887_55330 [Cichorium endivia]